MFTIHADNVVDYLRSTGRIARDANAQAETLAGGVSNIVLRITVDGGDDFVIKQSRAQLRTEAEWLSRVDRVFREVATMRLLADVLPPGAVPRVLFEDRDNYLFAMEAIEREHRVWKSELLAGRVDPGIADTLAEMLLGVHQVADDKLAETELDDLVVFDELRIDPFYRRLVQVHPQLEQPLLALIDELETQCICLVLGDFSPKNMLLTERGVVLVDFETAHFGNPAFDIGFFLSHLCLKAIRAESQAEPIISLTHSFWNRYRAGGNMAWLEEQAGPHLAACMLARIDGKSPVDYLSGTQQDLARALAIQGIRDAASVTSMLDRVADAVRGI